MLVVRLGENMLDIDGTQAILIKDAWVDISGERLSSVKLRELFLYLREEEIYKKKKFDKYVNNVIQELIYNKNEH
jgi:hypothetical protein